LRFLEEWVARWRALRPAAQGAGESGAGASEAGD
jgi:hypothetical protein